MINGLKEAFEQQREYLKKNNLKCTASIEGTSDVPESFYTDFIFLSRDGGCLHQGTVNKTIRRIIRDCNTDAMDKEGTVMLPKFSCHTFRSTYITRAAEKGVPIDVTMKQCGHSDRRTTELIYTTVSPEWRKRELTAMADLFD